MNTRYEIAPRQAQWLTWAFAAVAAAALLCAACGCSSQVDRDILKTRTSLHTAVDGYLTGVDEMLQALFERTLTRVADLERQAVAARQQAFLDRHTDDGGGIVSAAPDGAIAPMPRAQLEMFMADAADQVRKAESSAENGRRVLAEFRAARERLRALIAKLAAKEIEWQEAKESADAEVNRIMTMIGSLAGGAALGAGL